MNDRAMWQAHVAAHKRSGKTLRQYSVEAGISEKRLSKWRLKLTGGEFVQLAGPVVEQLELIFGNGLRVKVAANIEPALLRRLVEVLSANA